MMKWLYFLCLLSTLWIQGFSQKNDLIPEVISILETHCLSCHNPDDKKGKLDFSHLKKIFSKDDLIVPHKPDDSMLMWAIEGEDAEMPPKVGPLAEKDVQTIHEWIKAGAPWPEDLVLKDNPRKNLDWWSLKPITKVTPPIQDLHSVDSFLEKAREEKGISKTKEAEPETLVRRLYYDLIGLPPNPQEIRKFLSAYDKHPEFTWQQTVDELLHRSDFGEKWARHWLDLVRFAETHGYDKDKPRENAWPYRDYVIQSFNSDKPYSTFIEEQIAADVPSSRSENDIRALGFLAAGPWDFIGHFEVGELKLDGRIAKHIDRDEMVSATMNVFMSTTVQCAQCHHHKFDPILMEDYYQLHSIFASVDRADIIYDGMENRELKKDFYTINSEISSLKREIGVKKRVLSRKTTSEKAKEKLTSEIKKLEEKLSIAQEKLPKTNKLSYVYGVGSMFTQIGKHKPTFGKPRPIHVLKRGDMKAPGKQVFPGVPALWKNSPSTFYQQKSWEDGDERKQFSQYLSSKQNPLVWRSIVNRLWQWTYGRALVETPNDFGRMGMKPIHEDLLNYLAYQLKQDPNHSLKSILKLLFTSKTYRLDSSNIKASHLKDSNNRYFWKYNRRKLTAEEYRDSLLAISGKLNTEMYGPSFKDFVIEKPAHSPHYQYHLHDHHDPESHRKSIYRFTVRSQPHPFLTTLDCADPTMSIPKRDESTTALQALAQWNNPFVEAMSTYMGEKLRQSYNDEEVVEMASLITLCRKPSSLEHKILSRELNQHGHASLSRILFNMSAFNYVE